MTQTVYRCPAAMPTETLSAWYDRQLNTGEAERAREHIKTCPACQSYLTDYATATRGISQFDAPQLQERIWRGLQRDIGQAKQRRAAPARGVIFGGLGAAIAVVILFAAVAVLYVNNRGHSLTVVPTGTPAATATNALAPTATVPTLKVSPSQGWVNAPALAFAKHVAFVRDTPLAGYACGNATSAIQSTNAVMLSATHDGGLTWSAPLATPLQGADCALFLNPGNSQDIILTSSIQCYLGCSVLAGGDDYYTSRDSGATWTKITLPPSQGTTTYGVFQASWAGEDIFVNTEQVTGKTDAQPSYQLAVSIAGGAFSWIDANKISGGLPQTSLSSLPQVLSFVIGSTFYIQFADADCLASNTVCPFGMTADHGTTWQHFTPTGDVAGFPLVSIIVGGNGQTLYSQHNGGAAMSIDHGKTWVQLSGAANSSQYAITHVAPDGTLYGEDTAQTVDVYVLPANGSSWVKITTIKGVTFDAISWGKDGHPVALWARNASYSKNSFPPGIGYHAAVTG